MLRHFRLVFLTSDVSPSVSLVIPAPYWGHLYLQERKGQSVFESGDGSHATAATGTMDLQSPPIRQCICDAVA